MEEDFDREYYIAAICDKFGSDDVDVDAFFEAANKAIDKTLEQYTKKWKATGRRLGYVRSRLVYK